MIDANDRERSESIGDERLEVVLAVRDCARVVEKLGPRRDPTFTRESIVGDLMRAVFSGKKDRFRKRCSERCLADLLLAVEKRNRWSFCSRLRAGGKNRVPIRALSHDRRSFRFK